MTISIKKLKVFSDEFKGFEFKINDKTLLLSQDLKKNFIMSKVFNEL